MKDKEQMRAAAFDEKWRERLAASLQILLGVASPIIFVLFLSSIVDFKYGIKHIDEYKTLGDRYGTRGIEFKTFNYSYCHIGTHGEADISTIHLYCGSFGYNNPIFLFPQNHTPSP